MAAQDLADPFGLVGTVLEGEYRVDGVVGQGGFGVVYRGLHLMLDQPVAIKVLRGLDAEDPRINQLVLAKFREEARLLYTLSQSSLNIVRCIDFGAVTAPSGVWAPFMVLEWLEGRSLADDLTQRRARGLRGRSTEEALEILEPVAQGLAVAHRQHVAHRDVKPGNIFLLETGSGPKVKVLDFGIAKIMKEGEQAGTKGTFASFTWAYATPEQLDPRLGSTGLATDVYAFTLVLTQLLTDRPPVEEADVIGILKAATDPNRRPTPRTRGANVSDGLEDVCKRALSIDPAKRYPDIIELWAALGAARAARASVVTQAVPMSVVAPSALPSSIERQMNAPTATANAGRGTAPTPVPPHSPTQPPPMSALPQSPPMSPPIMTPPPGARPPYAHSPPLGTLPPGQTFRRPLFVRPSSGGSNALVIVTIVGFVVFLMFMGTCAAVYSAC